MNQFRRTQAERYFAEILMILRQRTGVDFSSCRHATVRRRILRRMRFRRMDNLESYAVYLKDHCEESRELFDDILIHVTGFSRAPQVFKALMDLGEREQYRIGIELHDGLCQQLAGIKLMSGLLEARLVRKGLAEARHARAIERRISTAMDQVRCLAHGLAPVTLEQQGLACALKSLVAEMKQAFRVDCQCDIRADLPPEHRSHALHLYRIAQESLHNAVKHGKASRLRLSLLRHHGRVILSVSDDGLGFPRGGRPRSGHGLHTMQYRSALMGGFLSIESESGGGTRVTCSVPFSRADPKHPASDEKAASLSQRVQPGLARR